MNILIYGSKSWKDYDLMKKYFSLFPKDAIVLTDKSPGASSLAFTVAEDLNINTKVIFPEIGRSFNSNGLFYDSYLTRFGFIEAIFIFKLFKPFCKTSHLIIERAKAKQIKVVEIFADGSVCEQPSLFGYTSPLKGTY